MKKESFLKRFFWGVLLLIFVLLYQGFYSDISPEELQKKYANEHSKFIEIEPIFTKLVKSYVSQGVDETMNKFIFICMWH